MGSLKQGLQQHKDPRHTLVKLPCQVFLECTKRYTENLCVQCTIICKYTDVLPSVQCKEIHSFTNYGWFEITYKRMETKAGLTQVQMPESSASHQPAAQLALNRISSGTYVIILFLASLLWLPGKSRIEFKFLLAYKVLNGQAPFYLKNIQYLITLLDLCAAKCRLSGSSQDY